MEKVQSMQWMWMEQLPNDYLKNSKKKKITIQTIFFFWYKRRSHIASLLLLLLLLYSLWDLLDWKQILNQRKVQ